MRYCDYVEFSTDLLDSEVFQDKMAFVIFLDLLFERDCDTNSLVTSWGAIGRQYRIDENTVKKKLFKLKKLGHIELYKTGSKYKIIVAFRKCEDLYRIGDFELFLDEELIIEPPKSYSRNDTGYYKFRKKVLERDEYRCKLCGVSKDLQVHHIKPYAKNPALRTSVKNGITLCKSCHKKVHSKAVDLNE